MKSLQFSVLALVALLAVSCGGRQETTAGVPATATDEVWERATVLFQPLPAVAANPENPFAEAKLDLGAKLYFDTRLSKDGNISCNSCHNLDTAGVDNLPFSPGDTGELGGRNSPTVFNAALHFAQFWDGRATDVEEQAGMPILNPVEMAIPDEQFLVDRLQGTEDYPPLFDAAFPADDPTLTYDNIRLAIAAFERTFLTPSRFDAYLSGDPQALSQHEIDGLETFMDLGCPACHQGVAVGGQSFQKFGPTGEYWAETGSDPIDEGRFADTGNDADRYVFKVASLRNVSRTGPYFHDGSVTELAEAIRVMARLQVEVELDDDQADQILAFLDALNGDLPATAKQLQEKYQVGP